MKTFLLVVAFLIRFKSLSGSSVPQMDRFHFFLTLKLYFVNLREFCVAGNHKKNKMCPHHTCELVLKKVPRTSDLDTFLSLLGH